MTDETPTKKSKPNWELQHRVFCVKNYYKCGSYKLVGEQFQTIFKTDKFPRKSIICEWVKKSETFGTVLNVNAKSDDRPTHSGRPKVRTDEVVDLIWTDVEQSPKRSIRKRSQALNLTYGTC